MKSSQSRRNKRQRRPKKTSDLRPVPQSNGTLFSTSMRRVSSLPPICNDTSFTFTRRYQATSTGGAQSVTRATCLNSLAMATATNAAYRICNAVRITKIKGWVSPATNSSYNNPTWFQWNSEDSPSKMIDLSAQQGQYGCYFETRPPRNSLASFWSNVGYDESTPLLKFATNGQLTLDITFTYAVMNTITGTTASAVTQAVSGATVGDVIVLPLDTGSKLVPANQNST
jgi:hypothetical protein